MRLDKWLKLSRVIKRRPVANAVCDQGRVQLNGRTAKASTEVREGDRVAITFGGDRILNLEVLAVPLGNVTAKAAHDLYRIFGEAPEQE